MTKLSPDLLRKQAKQLRKLHAAGDADARRRIRAVLGDQDLSSHSGALHVIAREHGFESWPKLKIAHELGLLDQTEKLERLRRALFHGQHWVTERLLAETPELANGDLGIECALYDVDAVKRRLSINPSVVHSEIGGRRPILHLAFSKHFQTSPGKSADMMAVAEMLVAAGADVNDGYRPEPDSEHGLSALYGALGHAGNLQLAAWLLDHEASPDDNESLYHATELDTLDGLRLLMRHGVTTEGTNVLPRMLDFDNYEGVKLLLEYGADPNEGIGDHPSGQPSMVIPALHQAARRNCSGAIIGLLLDHGADGRTRYQGHSAYALARIRGNREAARRLEKAGQATELDANEQLLAAAADGEVAGRVDADTLSAESRRLICRLLGFAGPPPLAHIKRLVEIGISPDWTDEMGLPAVQVAGWEGHADAVEWLLTFNPDLEHRNRFGGDLMETILHGAEFNPHRADRDHRRCAELVLATGVRFSRRLIDQTGSEDLAFTLEAWAEAHPEQVKS